MTAVKKWKVRFDGRRRGAIGVSYPIVLVVEAETVQEALLRVYDTHERGPEWRLSIEEVGERPYVEIVEADVEKPLETGVLFDDVAYQVSRYSEDGTWFVFSFGAYLDVHVLAKASSFERGLELASNELADLDLGEGVFEDPTYQEACEELGVGWATFMKDPDAYPKVLESAELDLTYTDSGWIRSDAWAGGEASEELATLAEATFSSDDEE